MVAKQETPNAMIIRHEDDRLVMTDEYVEHAPGKRFGTPEGEKHLLVERNGHFEAWEPRGRMDQPPGELYQCRDWRGLRRVLSTKSTMLEKINVVLLIALIGVFGFITFLILAEAGA